LAVAIEDAGFEIRDSIAWLYGSGFPKSHNISKAIDKAAGVEREVVGTKIASPKGISQAEGRTDTAAGAYGGEAKEIEITVSATDEAKQWDGWGTALKPAHEPIVVARKPLIGTVAENVLKYGTGAINIDATRIGTETININNYPDGFDAKGNLNNISQVGQDCETKTSIGRWPANIILDEFTAELLDEQSGTSKSLAHNRPHDTKWGFGVGNDNAKQYDYETGQTGYSDSGGASRFFYVAKASKRDRNEGLDELEAKASSKFDGGSLPDYRGIDIRQVKAQNFHPTVKPTALMQYLIRLVTPDNGVVLDPFTGSGSTGKAAILEGKRFIGIELTPEYLPIIEGRLKHAYQTLDDKEVNLFD
jgi:site-specific DNA-methyltransferase (adenine-specific)